MKNLAEIILEGYKEVLVSQILRNLNISAFRCLYEEVFEILGKTEEDVERIIKGYVYKDVGEPMIDLLMYMVNGFLREDNPGELWRDIVFVKRTEESTPYQINIKYTLQVKSREEIVSEKSSLWVLEHYQEVKEFMSPDNKLYREIEKLNGKYVEI